ncbi:hypothetical protein O6H91_09G039800 [Diphasiastrum complanatum]|uniref:Uncharacterized protein n=1 Tax=Diphasiastrum complanatum TaxID=34168 RepID=A0ACC2CNC5_DIPCM|nr:hypothetical protein O6H91_Y356300 [Diphasiastrum complanatum]KAJ7543481.1 hypothetical protein O6H91_09G039800 [Diphasiastrum complanatum]
MGLSQLHLRNLRDGVALGGDVVANELRCRSRRPTAVVVTKTKKLLSKQAQKIAKQADEHEKFLNKVKYCLGVFFFGTFCYLLGSRPQVIPKLYCLFFLTIAPLRWLYYRSKKWHYYLLDFCYYANVIFMIMLMCTPSNEKLFMMCFSFSEGPLAWALIVWRCSLVFSSFDKIVSVLIHLLPGTVFFIIRWWDPSTFPHHSAEVMGPWPAWPAVHNNSALWTWLFVVPLLFYTVWQISYFLIVNVMRRQRFMNDPDVMTSYRELARKASRADNIWWWLSGLLGDENRIFMYAILQGIFTVATMALTVPMFKSYKMHVIFELFKVTASIWNGGNFLFEVMPKQADKRNKKAESKQTLVEIKSKKDLNDLRPGSEVLSFDKPIMNGTVPSDIQNVGSDCGTMIEKDQIVCAVCKQSDSPVSRMRYLVEGINDCIEKQTQLQDTPLATGPEYSSIFSVRSMLGCSDKVDSVQTSLTHFDQICCET